jgi:hypothetical protein
VPVDQTAGTTQQIIGVVTVCRDSAGLGIFGGLGNSDDKAHP